VPTTVCCFSSNGAMSLPDSIQYCSNKSCYAIYFKITTVLPGNQKASLTIREAHHSVGLLTNQFADQKFEKSAKHSWIYFNWCNTNQWT